jgi:hypothetical protein
MTWGEDVVRVTTFAACPLIVCAVLIGHIQAQTRAANSAFTNADIIRLLGLGVSDRTVIAVIQEVKQHELDTGADAITALKASGASEALIAAIQRTPTATVDDDARIDRQKFTSVYAAGRAVSRAVASTDATVGQIDHLLQTFKTEVAGAKDKATTQGERSLVTKYAIAQLQFEAGLNQMNVPLRLDAWAKATTALEDADKIYLGK